MSNVPHKFDAQITWFDHTSGEGYIQLTRAGIRTHESLYINYTSIDGIDKNNYIGPSIKDQVLLSNIKSGDKLQVTLYENIYSRRVDQAWFDQDTVLE